MQLIACQAHTHPLRTAISSTGGRVSYAELLERVGRLASYLHSKQIGPGNTVAILLPRDASMVIAPLAVMAAGASIVPLDCASPAARLRECIEAAGVDLIIANRRTQDSLSADSGNAVRLPGILCLDDSEAAIASCAEPASWRTPAADHPAYIIFTSGSTGKPKGVVITHGNLAHYIAAMSCELDIAAADSYLHTASCAFSASLRQFLLPLVNGAQVVLADTSEIRNVEALLALVQRERVTILDLVPTLWRGCIKWLQLCAEAGRDFSVSHLRLALSASEPLAHSLATSLTERWPRIQLINMYGQTETSGIVAMHKRWHCAERSTVVALGAPIAGHIIHLVDEHCHRVPAGAIGEICVAGPCVGAGYLTGAPSAPKPFTQRLGSGDGELMLYRTGDLGRIRDDGMLEFCGRLDTQIKFRGFRIEPSEIESAALSHPRITEAAALVSGGATGSAAPQLQLFFCTTDDAFPTFDLAELRAWLAQRLPSYMVPARLQQVPAMPRTFSGKLDRDALWQQYADGAAIIEQPQNTVGGEEEGAIAQVLIAIWQEVLLCEPISVHDNFFDLGGNSLLSIEIVSAALDAGLQLTLDQVFQYQTIAELASVVRYRATAATDGNQPGRTKRPVVVARQVAPPARYTPESLRAFSREALEHAGLSPEGAAIVTEVQLESSLRGQATHNIGDIPRYARRLVAGVLNATPEIAVVETSALSATVDGDNGPGQWVATVAITKTIALAERSGAGIVGVRRSNHFGAAGHYAWLASRAGLVGLCFTNGPVVLAPSGGITPLFGNNPLAIGMPRKGGHPVVLDIAMAAATRGRIGLAVAEGQPLQPGWILDKLGLPTSRLEDLAAGLAVPVGGHKGYGLALAIEILAGALTGAGYCADHGREAASREGGSDIGHFFIAFDPALFIGREQFEARVADIVVQAKSSALSPGSAEILVPGELEFRAREDNLRHGVVLPASVARRLIDYSDRHRLNARIEQAPRRDVKSPTDNFEIRTSSDAH